MERSAGHAARTGDAQPDPELGDLELADLVRESMLLLGAGSTVLHQLALPEVGRGVAEHSTTLDRPFDRLRTTLTYVYVTATGTPQERQAVARMVNRVHTRVRGPGYSAHDRDLQLWVAATLAHNGIFIQERVHGPMAATAKERLYRQSWVFGTALQVREEDWPATYADFETYWEETLSTRLGSVPLVRAYARALLSTRGVPLPLRPAVRVQSLLARGNVSPRVREVLGLGWSPREQRRYDRLWRVHNAVYPRLPALVRTAPARLVLRDFRRRLRTGRRVI